MRTTTIVGLTALTTAALAAPAAVVAHDSLGGLLPVTRIAGSAAGSSIPNTAPGQSDSTTPGSNGVAPNFDGQGSSSTSSQTTSGTSTTATTAQQRGVVLVDTVTTNGEGAGTGMVLRSDDHGASWSYANTGYKGSFWTGIALPGGVLLAGGGVGIYSDHDDAPVASLITGATLRAPRRHRSVRSREDS